MILLSIGIGLFVAFIIATKFSDYILPIMGFLVAIGLMLMIGDRLIKSNCKYAIRQGDSIYYTDEYFIDEQPNSIRFHDRYSDKDIIIYGTYSIEERKAN